MKLNINNNDLMKINNLLNIDENNHMLSDFILDIIDNGKDISNNIKDGDNYFDAIMKYYHCDKDFKKLMKDLKFDKSIKELNYDKYANNPYFKNVKIGNIVDKNYKLEYQKYKSFEPFLVCDIEVDDIFNEHTTIGYFKNEYNYLTLSSNGNIWMLISPHEINTMQKAIDNAFGNVLCLGLGLGYFAYMVAIKDTVKSITIIEKDPEIIELFKKHILPYFPNIEINIICDDAISYLDRQLNYDYCFADLWYDVLDGMPLYNTLLKKEKNNPKMKYDYWIEKSMIIMARRCMLTLIYNYMNGIKMPYDIKENYYDEIINKFDDILKNYEIKSFSDVARLLHDDYLKSLIYQI